MTLRNWRLESHDVGQQQSESTKERGEVREVQECWICGCDWPQRRRIISSAQCFFFWLFEKVVSKTWNPEFGEM
jgi:hypothetical protein